DVGAAAREQAVGDHAADVVDVRLELGGIQDREILDVENDVAVVGREIRSQLRVATKLHQLVRDVAARHGNDFHRQGEIAQYTDQLALVHDADELAGDSGHDLFTGERAATALDHRAVLGHL